MKWKSGIAFLAILLTIPLHQVYGEILTSEKFQISLKSRSFTPPAEIALDAVTKDAESNRVHVLMQFTNIPDSYAKQALENAGIILLNYLPENTWFASIPVDLSLDSPALSSVRWIGRIHPEDKFAPEILEKETGVGKINLVIKYFKDADVEEIMAKLEGLGATIQSESPVVNSITISVGRGEILLLANEDYIRWIEPVPPPAQGESYRIRNHVQAGLAQSLLGLSGDGVTVGVFENSHVYISHPDFSGRAFKGDTDPDNYYYHGTNVAGVIGGDGSIDSNARGMAPDVDIYSYDYSNNAVVYNNGSSAHDGGAAIGHLLAADDFVFDNNAIITGASVDVSDGPANENRRWDWTVEWWILDDNGGAPGNIIASDVGHNIRQNNIVTSPLGFRDFKVDFQFGSEITVIAGQTYWLVLHLQDGFSRMSVVWDRNNDAVRNNGYYSGGVLVAGVPDFTGRTPRTRDLSFRLILQETNEQHTNYIGDLQTAILTHNIDIANNSWGSYGCDEFGYGDYIGLSPFLDGVVHGDFGKPITVVFSAGNERYGYGDWDNAQQEPTDQHCISDTDPPYINYGTMNHPKSAKNTIVVGAVDSYPLGNDKMTTYSNWGPTNDGRIKPEIVASGNHNGVDRSGATQPQSLDQLYSAPYYPPDYDYGYFGFTSCAAAATSGSIALLLEDFRNNAPMLDNPLPSTIKALLIHSAKDLDDSTSWYNKGPDYASGYGLLQIKDAIDLKRSGSFLEGQVEHGEEKSYSITVPADASSVKATLAWDDYPGVENADPARVNNLNLYLVDNNGVHHHPWTLDKNNPSAPATRQTGNIPDGVDDINNVEQVVIDLDGTGPGGVWLAVVKGYSVPEGPQKFSLVANEVKAQQKSDYDSDGDVDYDDMRILLPDRNKAVGDSSCGPDCDLDGDGMITVLDARILVTMCTRPRCATE